MELTDARLEHLTIWRPGDGAVRPTIELLVQVCARSRQALDAGDFHVVAPPGSTMDGGRTFGRFADLFDEDDHRELGRLASPEEAAESGVRYACLTYQAPQGRSANVSRHQPLRDWEICVNAAPDLGPDRQVRLEDVLVGAGADRLYLRWARTGEEIRVVQDHLLVSSTAPNACRFLWRCPMMASPRWPHSTGGRWRTRPSCPGSPEAVRCCIPRNGDSRHVSSGVGTRCQGPQGSDCTVAGIVRCATGRVPVVAGQPAPTGPRPRRPPQDTWR